MENNLLCFKSTSKLTALSLPKIYKEGFFADDGIWTKLTIIKGKMKLLDNIHSIQKVRLNLLNLLVFSKSHLTLRIYN